MAFVWKLIKTNMQDDVFDEWEWDDKDLPECIRKIIEGEEK